MREIHSKFDPRLLLHIVHRTNTNDANTFYRKNLRDEKQYLQAAYIRMPEGHTFKPHQHIFKDPPHHEVIAQESWVVVNGKVEVLYYDIDGKFLESVILEQGDITITFRGGHNYKALLPNTIVYEFKTGPYTGQENDKVFIEEHTEKIYESPDGGKTIYERTMLKNDRRKL